MQGVYIMERERPFGPLSLCLLCNPNNQSKSASTSLNALLKVSSTLLESFTS